MKNIFKSLSLLAAGKAKNPGGLREGAFSTLAKGLMLFLLTAPHPGYPIAKKAFDFVVGANGNFKAALNAASAAASSGNRYYIFLPNGEYLIGTLTGDTNQMTTITTSNISFIGESIDSAIISNKPAGEGISITATLYFNKANNLYMQDLTVLNKGNYGDPAAVNQTGRYVAIQDRGDRNIYKNVKLLSNQDTYYSQSSRTYWENSEIHGFVDFICGYGDVFFNQCLLYLENRSSVVITAPSTQTSWGYVFMNCTIDGAAGDGYRLGRAWSNEPRCVYINTTMKKIPAAAGWGDPMNVVPKLFAEYNSKTASGSSVDLSGRRTTYTLNGTTVTINPVLTASQAGQYTIKNALAGTDNWQPDSYTKQVSAPAVTLSNGTLTWNGNDSALCWIVFKAGKFYKCVTEPLCALAASDANTKFFVRAANAMGGLGARSNVVDVGAVGVALDRAGPEINGMHFNPAKKTLQLRAPSAAVSIKVRIFSLDGKQLLSREFPAGGTVSLADLRNGIYLVKASYDGAPERGIFLSRE